MNFKNTTQQFPLQYIITFSEKLPVQQNLLNSRIKLPPIVLTSKIKKQQKVKVFNCKLWLQTPPIQTTFSYHLHTMQQIKSNILMQYTHTLQKTIQILTKKPNALNFTYMQQIITRCLITITSQNKRQSYNQFFQSSSLKSCRYNNPGESPGSKSCRCNQKWQILILKSRMHKYYRNTKDGLVYNLLVCKQN
eukprot:TRINITY_DN6350_c0_g1_i2.p2 TRINITY_DN6350_c0_g1~~TRINITY_DN6350_c0_g1_i2.p2  ORF type:complete len:192 (+),score=-18.74 TRINITY_DN6350_c0_g1_i2:80-655(+)